MAGDWRSFCCLNQYSGGPTAVVLFTESKSQGLLFIYFQVPCRPREQRLRRFKSRDILSDERKKENEIIKYSVNRGEQYVQVKNERDLRKLGIESCSNSSNKSGSKRKFSLYSMLFTTVVVVKELYS